MINRISIITLIASASLLSTACLHEDDDDMMENMAEYQISIYNLTNNQPLTPIAAILHQASYSPWQLGMAASEGLEHLAESGATDDFLSTAEMQSTVVATATSSDGPIMPGDMRMISISASDTTDLELSVASMLANTNDAFTGAANWNIADLEVDESLMTMTMVYDAGTEQNSEAAGTIPGPVDGGEGFNATRDDNDRIVIHPGVVTMDDGLASSVLNESHRWLGAAAKVVVTRTQ